ncbi:hypothetical protein PROFUN_06759 [Planoprotostelium fungivorum]|uniref:Uncharacterized protein n=1 Tax=Planoprotostelium fungivorum TaxID=1890364 RepID=A0A2P6NNJ6_9EUKA|nr:hypothetical protein PROFUN_06759 [Planoprotostelium fungivorum]
MSLKAFQAAKRIELPMNPRYKSRFQQHMMPLRTTALYKDSLWRYNSAYELYNVDGRWQRLAERNPREEFIEDIDDMIDFVNTEYGACKNHIDPWARYESPARKAFFHRLGAPARAWVRHLNEVAPKVQNYVDRTKGRR